MSKNLVIVESPAKARTLGKYLGEGFEVRASMGHVIDLPEKKLGVDLDHDFQPTYQVIPGKNKVINELKRAAGAAGEIFLAPDPDREGEAIAWHLAGILGRDSARVHRVMFNEITKNAVLAAMQHPTTLNKSLFEAQQARRILDRLVGYQISPLLWKTVRRGLSAGRVQSVAVRMVCEREREIQEYIQKEYWSIEALLATELKERFEARLYSVDGLRLVTRPDTEGERKDRFWVQDADTANALAAELRVIARYTVRQVERKEKRRSAPPPFITSTMQREAAVTFGWPAKKTMQVAQTLYEGVDLGAEGTVGLITYMRTDSTRLAETAIEEARALIAKEFGEQYVPEKPIHYVSKKGNVQDAHEAIRATSAFRRPEQVRRHLTPDQNKLYSLVWARFVACQMKAAVYDQTAVDIEAGPRFILRAVGSIMRFAGFTRVYHESLEKTQAKNGNGDGAETESDEDRLLPPLEEGQKVAPLEVTPNQHFTQPPPRYTESSLIRELEANGIGRPSTYATIMSTILDKGYVERLKGALKPTELGFTVNSLLVEKFPDILNVKFTARMEGRLDEVEEGQQDWHAVLREFYDSFKPALETALANRQKVTVSTEIACEQCGAPMVIRWSRHGEFLGCSNFPQCKNTRQFKRDERGGLQIVSEQVTGETCSKCGSPMARKNGPYGPFLACTNYPACSEIRPLTTGIACPREGCKGELSERRSRRGKTFWGCTAYPACDYASWDRPIDAVCPTCGARPLFEKTGRRMHYIYCEACKGKFSEEQLAHAPEYPAGEAGQKV